MDEILIEKVLNITKKRNTDDAIQMQKKLLERISLSDNYLASKLIAGVDIAYENDQSYCAIVVMDSNTMEVIEKVYSKQKVRFPYIPGLLFYREFPVFFSAFKKIVHKPDIIVFDGQGLSHQRMMGIATMSGILLDIPTIGCAKSHLYGNYQMPGPKKFSSTELSVNDKVIGYVLRSKDNLKPIFISTGYRVSPESSLEIVKKLLTNYKLPLPTHLAHIECENYKKTAESVKPGR